MKLNELRKNPEQNIVMFTEDIIGRFSEQPNAGSLFVHFSDIEKLGVNPKYQYTVTPMGIHCYPLLEVHDNAGLYAGNKKYFFVFEADKSQMLELSTYNEDDLVRDVRKLNNLYPDITMTISGERMNVSERHSAFELWNITRQIAVRSDYKNIFTKKWTYIFRQLGYKGFYDNQNSGFIAGDIPNQALILDFDIIGKKKLFLNKRRDKLLSKRDIEVTKRINHTAKTISNINDLIEFVETYQYLLPMDELYNNVSKKLLSVPSIQKQLLDKGNSYTWVAFLTRVKPANDEIAEYAVNNFPDFMKKNYPDYYRKYYE